MILAYKSYIIQKQNSCQKYLPSRGKKMAFQDLQKVEYHVLQYRTGQAAGAGFR